MLPFRTPGTENAGMGATSRDTRLSHDEQRMLMTLWCIFPSPLIVGGDLPAADAWTLSLLTNPEVIAVDQHSSGNRPVINTDRGSHLVGAGGNGGRRVFGGFSI